jgi:hypothetical protein
VALKARLAAAERRLGGLRGAEKKPLRIAVYYDDDARPVAGPGEELLTIHVVHTRDEEHTPPAMRLTAEARLAAEVKALERERDALRAKGKKKNARG